MNVLAIIPARSGSKGLIDKNITMFNDKPLIATTIETAIESGVFSKILVSTDSVIYSEISKSYGASINSLRSADLSKDETSTIDVILSVLDEEAELGNRYDIFVLLQPTSPLRDSKDIIDSLKVLTAEPADFVISVSKYDKNPNIIGTLDGLSMRNFNTKELQNARRQDADLYFINGAIYVAKVREFIKTKSFYTNRTYAYKMPRNRAIDIDDIEDLEYAEYLARKIK